MDAISPSPYVDATDHEQRDHRGNEDADEAAKLARADHPRAIGEIEKQVEFYLKRAPLVAHAIAVAMAYFPSRGERLSRREGGAEDDGRGRMRKSRHAWRNVDGTWRCDECNTWQTGSGSAKPPSRLGCRGAAGLRWASRFAALGHKVCQASGSIRLWFCSRCGGFAHRRAFKLGRASTAPTVAGQQALMRIAKGVTPWQSLKAGKATARMPIRATATFNPELTIWVMRERGTARRRSPARDPLVAQSAIAGGEGEETPTEEIEISGGIFPGV